MPRRLLAAVATLSTLPLLTACHGSPEAGHPNTTPASDSPTASPTPSAPHWTPEEQAAIAAAKARYLAATSAIDKTFMNPSGLDRSALEKAGLGGEWIITIVDQARTLVRSGLYQTGSTQVANAEVASVKLEQAQPEVNFINCLDSSKQVIRFKKNGKPVPADPGEGTRRKVASHLVFAAPADNGKKMWFLISDEDKGPC
jgi:hypothetical protein